LYLLSKIKFKYIAVLFLSALLIFLPFKNTFKNFLTIFSEQLSFSPQGPSGQIRKLKRHNLLITLELESLKYLKEENEKLREALNFKEAQGLKVTGAEVIIFSPSQWQRSVIINCGKDKKIKKNFLAVDEKGNLLGKVAEAGQNSSRLILVNDPNFNLPVFIGKNTVGLLKGNIYGAKILYVEDGEKIKNEDTVWLKTSSSAANITVGKIKKIRENSNSLFYDIDVTLASQNALFHEVFIIE